MTNKQILEKVETAIDAIERCGGKPHFRLARYKLTLEMLIQWKKRLSIAEKRAALYAKRKRHYERWMNYHEEP